METYQYDLLCSDAEIWKLWLGKYEYKCVDIALCLDLFDVVSKNKSISRKDIIETLKLEKRGGEALVNVLTASNYLKVLDGKYFLSEKSIYLTSTSPYSWKAMLNWEIDDKGFDVKEILKDMRQNEKKGTDSMKAWDAGEIDLKLAESTTKCMHSHSIVSAINFSKNVNLKNLFGISSLLDLGGGSGCFSIAVSINQSIKTIVYDLPNVVKVAESFINSSKVSPASPVLTYGGNWFKEDLPANNDPIYGYQGIFLSNILHDWDQDTCEFLCRKIYDSLPIGGSILIHEALFNDDFSGPLIPALFSFKMYLCTFGKQFSFSELKDLLSKCGFKEIGVLPASEVFSIVHGKKI